MAEDIIMDSTQKAVGSIPPFPSLLGFVASDGVTPARIGSIPVWESLDLTVCTVSADPDGMTNIQIVSADIPLDDPARTGRVKMTVDVDRGTGIQTREFFFGVTITSLAGPNADSLGGKIFTITPK